MNMIKKALKNTISQIPLRIADKILRNSLNNEVFNDISSIEGFPNRENLWNSVLQKYEIDNKKILYIEFGVYQGESLRYFAENNKNKDSLFLGLDTFEGIEETWVDFDMKVFDQGGKVPNIDDARITFIKGYFQNNRDALLGSIKKDGDFDAIIVHYDADLYSSTLFGLATLDTVLDSYIAIFDEFYGGENLAFYNYLNSHMAEYELIGKTDTSPTQVATMIKTLSSKS